MSQANQRPILVKQYRSQLTRHKNGRTDRTGHSCLVGHFYHPITHSPFNIIYILTTTLCVNLRAACLRRTWLPLETDCSCRRCSCCWCSGVRGERGGRAPIHDEESSLVTVEMSPACAWCDDSGVAVPPTSDTLRCTAALFCDGS